jgi:FkbM family methyltransferase
LGSFAKIIYYFNEHMKNLAAWLHAQYNKVYSYYKVAQTGVITNHPLNATERGFYLKLQSILQGESLVIYDIGAARGIVSTCLAKLPNVKSIQAFEPIPDIYKQLLDNVQKYPQVRCHNVALGDAPGEALMYISGKTDSSSLLPMADLHTEQFPGTQIQQQIKVPVVRLDDYVEQHQLIAPDIIKIDVQGFEENTIRGGQKTISQAKYCVLEMSFQPLYEGSLLFDAIYQVMRELNFNLIGVSTPLTGKSGIQLQVDGIFENNIIKN